MPLFILIGLYTGRRKEAILSLRWPQIDLVGGVIDFEIAGRARTKKRRGQIPIPARLLFSSRAAASTVRRCACHSSIGCPAEPRAVGCREATDAGQLQTVL